MARSYGQDPICPDDGGLLLAHPDWGGRWWCPNAGHGGNGAFFDPGSEDRGVPTDRKAPKPATAGDLAAAVAIAGEREKQAKADAAKADREERQAKQAARSSRPKREPRECKCGCGGTTKGGTFLPGHDAKYHARIRAERSAMDQ